MLKLKTETSAEPKPSLECHQLPSLSNAVKIDGNGWSLTSLPEPVAGDAEAELALSAVPEPLSDSIQKDSENNAVVTNISTGSTPLLLTNADGDVVNQLEPSAEQKPSSECHQLHSINNAMFPKPNGLTLTIKETVDGLARNDNERRISKVLPTL